MVASARRLSWSSHWNRPRGDPSRWLGFTIALALLDVLLVGLSLRLGLREVRDGAGSVTTGNNVALAIVATLAIALFIQAASLPPELRRRLQAFALGAQALHALGHLARWYYVFRWYDDVLHFGVVLAATLLALELVQAWNIFPREHHTKLRVIIVAFAAALALGAAWEIFEFLMDKVQGTREQDDLTDTMMDMIDGALGGLAAGAVGMLRIPRGSTA